MNNNDKVREAIVNYEESLSTFDDATAKSIESAEYAKRMQKKVSDRQTELERVIRAVLGVGHHKIVKDGICYQFNDTGDTVALADQYKIVDVTERKTQ